jgi:hypothetical protein
VPAWEFRDDTGLESHSSGVNGGAQNSNATREAMMDCLRPEKRGKIRRIGPKSEAEAEEDDEGVGGASNGGGQEKTGKQRKKWSMEETNMLADGCIKACFISIC